jgi:non-ribosomal peptide synthetase component E (peptide arylation enzyme)
VRGRLYIVTAETTTEIPSQEQVQQYLTQGYWDETIPLDYLYRHADATPGREALVDSTKRLTFAEVVKSLHRLALKFHEVGIRSGDRVGRQLPVCVDGQIVDLALSAVGAVYMTVPLQARETEWAHLLNATDAVAMIIPTQHGGFDFVAMAQSVKASHPSVKHIFVHDGDAPSATIALEAAFHENLESKYPPGYIHRLRPKASMLRQIMSSSGTTGTPKFTQASYYPSMFIYRTLAERFRMEVNDVVLIISPGGAGGVVALPALISGTKIVFMERFEAESALEVAAKEKATIIAGTATQFIKMAEVDHIKQRYDLSRLRLVTNAAASLPPEIAQRIERELGARVMNIFGTTDAGVPASTSMEDPPELTIRTAGKALPGVEFRIVDDEGNDLPSGEMGEIVWRGPCMYGGYYKNPSLNRTKYKDGWYFSGDMGALDKDGYLTIGVRKDYTINRGGQKISPAEIEELLYLHPAVKEAVVIPMPDRVLGQKACAYVVLRQGAALTFGEMVQFLKSQSIAVYKLPERLEIMHEFPVSGGIPRVMRVSLIADITGKLKKEGFGGNET